MQRHRNKTLYIFRTGKRGVLVDFQPLMSLGTVIDEIRFGKRSIRFGKLVTSYERSPSVEVKVNGETTVEVIHRGGVGIVPQLPDLKPGQKSEGLRVISEKLVGGNYEIVCEGLPGRSYELKIVDADSTILSVDDAWYDQSQGLIRVQFEGAKSPVRKTISAQLRPA